jgi:hypothetical protein
VGHRKLFSKPGNDYLAPSAVVARLRAHFNHVETDPQQGAVHVTRMVEQLTRMQFLKQPPATPEEIERLRGLREQSVCVTFFDDPASPDACLTTTIIPGEPLFFGFSSAEHERLAMPLLERCARVLDYEIWAG